jgi:ubiquinone/menaquinone biosynthesis C-methylase UbiE
MNNPVQEFFESEACCYEEHFVPRKSGRGVVFQTRLALARQLSQGCAGSMLDCATGTGEISAAIYASGRFQDATLVDISPEMLRRAQLRFRSSPGHGARFVQADIFKYLPGLEAGAKFDLIVCLGLIAHTGRLEELLRSFRTHLADGGRILLQTSFLDHWGNRLWRLLSDQRATRRQGYAFSYYTQQQIIEAVLQAQLAILAVRRYGVGLPFLEKVAPWANYQFEVSFSSWASRNGAEAIYLLGKPGEAGERGAGR